MAAEISPVRKQEKILGLLQELDNSQLADGRGAVGRGAVARKLEMWVLVCFPHQLA